MKSNFNTIGIICYTNSLDALSTCKKIFLFLKKENYNIIVNENISCYLLISKKYYGNLTEIGKKSDLAIVVGGDGSMISTARTLSYYNNVQIIGVNKGHLGFLTDLDPNKLIEQLSEILKGNYYSEKRFLLEIQVINNNKCINFNNAINEVIVYPGKISNMIEFDVYIDNNFSFSQRSDGLIISTPTGSTAYSLSAGGPILTPIVDAISLISIFPHNLSYRPLIINSSSTILLVFSKFTSSIRVHCDSQIILPVKKKQNVFIKRSKYFMKLIHPYNYNYFNVLNKKIGWSNKLF